MFYIHFVFYHTCTCITTAGGTTDAGKLSVDQIIIIVGFSIIAGILILILCWITKKGKCTSNNNPDCIYAFRQ